MRMHLIAYVCSSGRVVRWPAEGSTEFVDVFNNRTSGCRYAVVEPVRSWGPRGRNLPAGDVYWLIDLYDARVPHSGLRLPADIHIGNYQVFPTEAAAIMAGVLSHE